MKKWWSILRGLMCSLVLVGVLFFAYLFNSDLKGENEQSPYLGYFGRIDQTNMVKGPDSYVNTSAVVKGHLLSVDRSTTANPGDAATETVTGGSATGSDEAGTAAGSDAAGTATDGSSTAIASDAGNPDLLAPASESAGTTGATASTATGATEQSTASGSNAAGQMAIFIRSRSGQDVTPESFRLIYKNALTPQRLVLSNPLGGSGMALMVSMQFSPERLLLVEGDDISMKMPVADTSFDVFAEQGLANGNQGIAMFEADLDKNGVPEVFAATPTANGFALSVFRYGTDPLRLIHVDLLTGLKRLVIRLDGSMETDQGVWRYEGGILSAS